MVAVVTGAAVVVLGPLVVVGDVGDGALELDELVVVVVVVGAGFAQ